MGVLVSPTMDSRYCRGSSSCLMIPSAAINSLLRSLGEIVVKEILPLRDGCFLDNSMLAIQLYVDKQDVALCIAALVTVHVLHRDNCFRYRLSVYPRSDCSDMSKILTDHAYIPGSVTCHLDTLVD